MRFTTGTRSVEAWKSFNRNGRDVSTTGTKPVFVPGALSEFPCLRFSSSPMDSAATIETGSTYSVITLVKDNSASAVIQEPFSIGTSLAATSLEFLLDYDGSLGINRLAFFNSAVRAKTTANYSDSPALLAMGLTGGISNIRANGVNGTPNGSGYSTSTAVFRVGGSRPQNLYPLNGDLYALAVIADPIGSLNYLKAEAWIAWEFGVQSLLGLSHPYRFSPPRDNRYLKRRTRTIVSLAREQDLLASSLIMYMRRRKRR